MFKLELNNAKVDPAVVNPQLKATSKFVEIFSAVSEGKDISRYGKAVDTVMGKVKELSERALKNDPMAISELNEIVRYDIAPKLLEEIKLFNFMGTFRTIGYNEQAMMRTYAHQGVTSNFQAARGDVPFATTEWREYAIGTQSISSGYAIDYRELLSGNLDKVAEGKQQVQTAIRNKAALYVVAEMYKAIKNATGVKYFGEDEGIQKQSLDTILQKVRRFGRPAIQGDYSVVSQLSGFSGYSVNTPAGAGVPEAALEEIRKTGLLSTYNGSPVIELPNQYDLTTMNAAKDNFETLLPEGLLFFVPQGAVSPLQIFQRGGLTSATGFDPIQGKEITRFDLEIGAGVAQGREFEIGLLADTNYETPEA
jgi:hypothetical protein